MNYENSINICGVCESAPRYSHEYNGVPFYITNILCKRTNPRSKSDLEYRVRCYIPHDLIDQCSIEEGQLYSLSGQLINSKVKGLIDISMLVGRYEEVDEVIESPRGEVTVAGEVTKIFTNPDNYKGFINFIITLFDEEGNKTFSTRVIIWNKLGRIVLDQLEIGDKVLVKGFINNSETWSRPRNPEEEKSKVVVSELLGIYFTKVE